MSTLFQARAKLSWSDAEAFVPENALDNKEKVEEKNETKTETGVKVKN